ncbi:MAG: DnaA/Hda family protein, partial [Fibrobacteraceae bacterium]|nr:DnaA/Hda family protein [Fibrobacteraceae bacterium]
MLVDNVVLSLDAAPDLWSATMSHLRSTLSRGEVEMWFCNLHLESISDNGCAKLVAANSLVASWIDGHFKNALLAALKKASSEISDYAIVISQESKASPVPLLKTAPDISLKPRISPEKRELEKEAAATLASFYADYSFDTFVEGDSNRLALMMSRTVAENPSESQMNPFVLYGGPGVGKTHLLESIGRYAIMYKTAKRVVFRTAEQFLKDFVKSQVGIPSERFEASRKLRYTYEEPDLLLIDDIQVLAGKGSGATEKELFSILQTRCSGKKQTVFCSDRRPSEVPRLYEGFARFEGNSVAVDTPDLLTRINILRRKAVALDISQEERERIFHWVATHQRGNVREIEGIVTKLFAYHDLLKVNLTLESLCDLCGSCNLPSEGPTVEKTAPSIASIMEVTALAFKVPVESLRANT